MATILTRAEKGAPLTHDEMDANLNALEAREELGAMAPAVQALIDAAVSIKVDKGSDLSNLTGDLSSDSVIDETSGLTITEALVQIRASIQPGGATAPVPSAAPTLAFTGGTGDVGETATITQGTYSSGTVLSRKWNVNVNGSIVEQVASGTTFTIPASAGTGARQLSVTELYTWANGIDVIGLTSTTATINAPPAVPVVITPPTWGTGQPQVGTTFDINHGSWTNTPTSYLRTIYSGWVSASNKGTALTTVDTATYTIASTDAGATLVIGEVATNATGSSVESFSSAIVITASAGAPQWVDASGIPLDGAVLPSFPTSTYQSGETAVLDFGVTVGNASPSGYNVQMLRDGASVGMPGSSGVSTYSYTFNSSDDGHIISFTITASNAGGTSRQVTAAGVVVSGVAAGGGTGGVLSGSLNKLSDNTAATAYDLATLGSVDWWACFESGSLATPDTKSGGPASITASAIVGTVSDASTGHMVQFLKFSGGTPTATNTSSPNGDDGTTVVAGPGPTPAVSTTRFTIDIGTTQRTISIWFLSNPADTVAITASLSDGSASNYTYSGTNSLWNSRLDLTAKAGAASQTLTVDIVNQTGSGLMYYQGVAIA